MAKMELSHGITLNILPHISCQVGFLPSHAILKKSIKLEYQG